MTSAADPHRISITPNPRRVRVAFKGTVVADTTRALILAEGSLPKVNYVPRQDATMAAFTPTERRTHCPFKGDANYFNLSADGATAENAVWTYETPLPGVEQIAGHLAFYPDKVTIEEL